MGALERRGTLPPPKTQPNSARPQLAVEPPFTFLHATRMRKLRLKSHARKKKEL